MALIPGGSPKRKPRPGRRGTIKVQPAIALPGSAPKAPPGTEFLGGVPKFPGESNQDVFGRRLRVDRARGVGRPPGLASPLRTGPAPALIEPKELPFGGLPAPAGAEFLRAGRGEGMLRSNEGLPIFGPGGQSSQNVPAPLDPKRALQNELLYGPGPAGAILGTGEGEPLMRQLFVDAERIFKDDDGVLQHIMDAINRMIAGLGGQQEPGLFSVGRENIPGKSR